MAYSKLNFNNNAITTMSAKLKGKFVPNDNDDRNGHGQERTW